MQFRELSIAEESKRSCYKNIRFNYCNKARNFGGDGNFDCINHIVIQVEHLSMTKE